jgi:hypothetical protein
MIPGDIERHSCCQFPASNVFDLSISPFPGAVNSTTYNVSHGFFFLGSSSFPGFANLFLSLGFYETIPVCSFADRATYVLLIPLLLNRSQSKTSSRGTKREIFFGILELFAPFALKNTGYTFRLQSECLWQFQNPNYQRALRFFRVTFPPIWVYWRYYKMHRITEALFACF